jgi:hypothetical protein
MMFNFNNIFPIYETSLSKTKTSRRLNYKKSKSVFYVLAIIVWSPYQV